MDPQTTSAPRPGAPAGPTSQPTSGRENGGLMYFFIGAAVLALLLVIGFNVLGPEGASRTGIGDGPAQSSGGPSTGGPSPASSPGTRSQEGATTGQGAGNQGASGSPAATTEPIPQAADTPTPAGRESIGAPLGAAPQSGQARPEGSSGGGGSATTADAPPTAAQSAASAPPAAPPASR